MDWLKDHPLFVPEAQDGGACSECGCTAANACYRPDQGTCWWVAPGLCSHCARPWAAATPRPALRLPLWLWLLAAAEAVAVMAFAAQHYGWL